MSDNKDWADKIRAVAKETFDAETRAELTTLADRLDPPKPKVDRSLRGLVKVTYGGLTTYRTALADGLSDGGRDASWRWDDVDERGCTVTPVRVLADDEVAVKVPPMEEWPTDSWRMVYGFIVGGKSFHMETAITRAEAEALHRGRA